MASCGNHDDCESGLCWNQHCTVSCTTSATCGTEVCVEHKCTPLEKVGCAAQADCAALANPRPCQAPICAGNHCAWQDLPGQTCQAGLCAGICAASACKVAPTACNDGDACTTDTCQPTSGCSHASLAEGSACTPGDPCIAVAHCHAGSCTGTPVACDDGNVCTADVCDNSTGGCIHTASLAGCSDGKVCTIDACKDQTCSYVPETCSSFAGAVCSEPGGCACSSHGAVAIPTATLTVCAPDYPEWGVRPADPATLLVDNGDGTVTDTQSKRMWTQSLLLGDMTYGAPPHALCTQLKLAGYGDWRLPTLAELGTLYGYSLANAQATGLSTVFVWPSKAVGQLVAGQLVKGTATPWFVDFQGRSSPGPAPLAFAAACVRQLNSPNPLGDTGRFAIAGDGTVQDKVLGLTWQRAATAVVTSTYAVLSNCQSLALAGGGWRAPTVQELASLLDRQATGLLIDMAVFGPEVASAYWSATSYPTGQLWRVRFDTGVIENGDPALGADPKYTDVPTSLRCVR